MSIKAMNWAFELPLKPTPKLILLVLADMADDSGRCFPAHKTIARKSSVSVSTVKRALENMQQQGLLKKHIRRNGQENLSNCYVLNLANTTPVQNEPPSIHGCEPTLVHPDELETQFNRTTTHTTGDVKKIETVKQFDEFFSQPPKKNAHQFAMHHDWQPDENLIAQAAALGVNLPAIINRDPETIEQALVEFKTYWLEQRPFDRGTQRFWQQRFINNVKRQFAMHGGSQHARSHNAANAHEQRQQWSDDIFNAPGCESIDAHDHAAIFGE